MTIRLENVGKNVRVKGKSLSLFSGLNLSVERGARVGILGLPKSGKSTLLGLICGSEHNYRGRIVRDMSCSWPVPFNGCLAPTSTIAWSLRWVARLYGVNDPGFAGRVGRMAQAEGYVNATQGDCPMPIRAQIAFALALAIDFDVYLFDNMAVPGSKEFKETGKALLAERAAAGRAIVVASGNEAEVAANCQSAYVLENSAATYFPDVEEAVKCFKALRKAEGEKQKLDAGERMPEAEDASTTADSDAGLDMIGAALADI